VLGASGVALFLVAAGCGDYDKEYHITVDDRRGAGNMLEGVVIEGEGFSPNGSVLVTFVLSATGGNTQPYVEETIQADANGEFRLEKQPLTCPQPADYRSGSWTLIVARDQTSGISGSQTLEPGEQPDCTGGG
jgi:hypothetical protein